MAKQPEVVWSALPAADGSAQYEHEGYSILAAVNGPLEVQRRDEIPNEAFLEVNVREARGGGGPRERLLETQLTSALRPLLLVSGYPRTLIQLTIQILRTPEHALSAAPTPQTATSLPLLAPCFNSAVCALLDGNLVMSSVAMACTVQESSEAARKGGPCHVFAYEGKGSLLLSESEGFSSAAAWQASAEYARAICLGHAQTPGLTGWLRQSVARDHTAKSPLKADPAET